MINWFARDENKSMFKVEIDLQFVDWRAYMDFSHKRHIFTFGIQARLSGLPFLIVSLDGRPILSEEDMNIYPVINKLVKNECVKINYWVHGEGEDGPVEKSLHKFTKFEMTQLGYLLSASKFRNQYGFWQDVIDCGI